MKEKIEELKEREKIARMGGGTEQIEKQHARKKRTARERIDLLLDEGSFKEIEMFVTHRSTKFGMEKKKYFGDGVVTGSGEIDRRVVYVFAQDFTVMGGSLGEAHAKKICHVMELGIKTGCPIIGLIDSGGARIQEGLGHYGSIFYRNTLASGIVPQISLILGPCAGGAVYSPALSDFVFMVEEISRMHITGPEVIRVVTGEKVEVQDLGGTKVHSEKSGVAHFVTPDEKECFLLVRKLLSFLPSSYGENPPSVECHDKAARAEERLQEIIPEDPKRPYDMRDVVRLIVDDYEFFEIQQEYAKNVLIGFVRLLGETIGIVANQPSVYAGCLDSNASTKAARFIRFCDAFNIPILNLVDCPGYLPGTQQEQGGIIRHGAKMLYAYCEATVPKISVVIRKIYGGAMSGMGVSKLVGTDLTVALPTAEIAVTGPEAASYTIFKDEISRAENPAIMRLEKTKEYREKFANPYVAAEEGWIDAVIEPSQIRPFLITWFERLKGKREIGPKKKHGNIPL
jgi:acetyl-CoA carboxylase carboxyltransferase component